MLRQRRCTLNLKSPLSNGSVEDFLNEVTSPIQNVLDGASEGWALSYADLSPDTEQTIPGIAFLITNIAYAVAGTLLAFQGDVGFGLLVDVAAFVSFNYHCKQLEVEGSMGAPSVRLALLIDYLVAGTAILCGTFFMLTTPTFPLQGAIFAGVSLVFLGLCWIYEEGKPYMGKFVIVCLLLGVFVSNNMSRLMHCV